MNGKKYLARLRKGDWRGFAEPIPFRAAPAIFFPFTALTYYSIYPVNIKLKVQEIRALLAQWSKRNLTPLGRVTVIKTLAISKVNHLFLSLPNPGENIIKQLNTLFFNYLWNGPTDRVKRDVVIKPYHLGGLKMLDVKSFISAMKVSWIRRISNKDTKWLDLHLHVCPFMNNFMKFGPNYIYGNIHRINNDFWKDVYKSYADFSNLVKATTFEEFIAQPICYNEKFQVGDEPISDRRFHSFNVSLVRDLLKSNGLFLLHEEFNNTYNMNVNFIAYNGIILSIRSAMRSQNIISTDIPNYVGPYMPLQLSVIVKSPKGSKDIYNVFINNQVQPSAVDKWNTIINIDRGFSWTYVFSLPFKTTLDTQLRFFQYRINHRILGTNSLLHKIGN